MTAWPMVPLAEILSERKERVGTIDADELPLLGVSNKEGLHVSGMPRIPDMSRYLRVEKGWFAYNPMRVNVGSVGWAHSDSLVGAISPDYVVFCCAPMIDPQLLYWFLTSMPGLREINMQTAGSVRERLYFGSLARVTMPLPPIEEQRRIVGRIQKLKSKADEVVLLNKQSVELAVVLFYLEAKRIRKALLSEGGSRPMSEITKVCSGGTPDRSNPTFWQDGTIPWVKTGELCDDEISDTEEKITHQAVSNSGAKLFPPETVLIAMYGQGQTRGRTALLKVAATTNQACAAMLPKPTVFVSKYLQYWLRSLYHEMRTETRAGAQPNWNAGMIGRIPVVVPSLERQCRIIQHLDALEQQITRLRKLEDETSTELSALMPSVLSHAFSGQI